MRILRFVGYIPLSIGLSGDSRCQVVVRFLWTPTGENVSQPNPLGNDRESSHPGATIPCNLCSSQQVSILSNTSRERRPLRTVICQNCGLAWTDPRPHQAREFYADEYRLSYKGSYSPKPKHVYRAGNVAIDRYRRIQHHLPLTGSVLDVGSGGGEFTTM